MFRGLGHGVDKSCCLLPARHMRLNACLRLLLVGANEHQRSPESSECLWGTSSSRLGSALRSMWICDRACGHGHHFAMAGKSRVWSAEFKHCRRYECLGKPNGPTSPVPTEAAWAIPPATVLFTNLRIPRCLSNTIYLYLDCRLEEPYAVFDVDLESHEAFLLPERVYAGKGFDSMDHPATPAWSERRARLESQLASLVLDSRSTIAHANQIEPRSDCIRFSSEPHSADKSQISTPARLKSCVFGTDPSTLSQHIETAPGQVFLNRGSSELTPNHNRAPHNESLRTSLKEQPTGPFANQCAYSRLITTNEIIWTIRLNGSES